MGNKVWFGANQENRRMQVAKTWRVGLVLALCSVASVAKADVWDTGTPNDNSPATQNELVHGSNQVHDLAAAALVADVDIYKLGQPPYSSWEVVVDGTAANLGFGVSLTRMADGSLMPLQTAVGVSSLGFSRSLRWQNTTAAAVTNEYVRTVPSGCSSNCTANEVYRIRAYETTLSVPRFNNYGQVTVLVVQNTAAYAITGTVYFWNASGTLLTTAPLAVSPASNIPAKQLMILGLPAIPALVDQSGSITISHDGRVGDLTGKGVTMEVATGYSFDTLMVGRP